MEIRKNRLKNSQVLLRKAVTLLVSVTLFTSGCLSARKKQSRPFSGERPSEVYGPPSLGEVTGPNEAQSDAQTVTQKEIPSASYGPSPVMKKPVVLVFGPGLAKGFSYVGVIRALSDAKIPIAAIYGTEMGGFIGALYAFSSNLNQFEWSLQKFKEEVFEQKKGFLGKSKSDPTNGMRFEGKLREIFQNRDLSQARIPLYLSIQGRKSGDVIILNKGNAVQAVRAVLASPRLFTPSVWNDFGRDDSAVSAEGKRPFLVKEARELGLGPVIVVDVASSAERNGAAADLEAADLVIHPKMKGVSHLDFGKRNEAAFRGKSALSEHLSELKKLVE